VDGGPGVLDGSGGGPDEGSDGGFPPAPTTGPTTLAWGARFLIKRFRPLWSRRAGWAYPLASETVASTRAMTIQKRRVRESLLGMVINIKIGRVDRWGQEKDGRIAMRPHQ
jgi:hypothetical protein